MVRVRPAGPGPAAYREVASFSTWRSGQLMMRPLGMLLARLAVSAIVSRSALGLMEAGRLIIAPVMTAANGLGGFSLPYFTRHRDEGDLRLGLVARFAALSAVVAAVYAPVAFLVASPVPQRVFWFTFEGLLAIALMLGGGLTALQAMAVSTGFPFTIVLLGACYAVVRGLMDERTHIAEND